MFETSTLHNVDNNYFLHKRLGWNSTFFCDTQDRHIRQKANKPLKVRVS